MHIYDFIAILELLGNSGFVFQNTSFKIYLPNLRNYSFVVTNFTTNLNRIAVDSFA